MKDSIKVFAPATVANVGCGFDVLGFALNQIGDVLEVHKNDTGTLVITDISGDSTLSKKPEENVVTVSVMALLDDLDAQHKTGFNFKLTKQVKPGSGLGSSASSSAAAVFAVNELLGRPYEVRDLILFAMEGEKLASGNPHADNVAPALLGGFTLIRSYEPLDVIALEYPDDLFVTVVHPQIEVRTSEAKKMLREHIELKDAITQWGNIAGLVSGLARPDYELIGRSLHDVIAEPVRGMLIPHYREAKQLARKAGGLGSSISGSGPAIFVLSKGRKTAESVAGALRDLYRDKDLDARVYVSEINARGTEIIQ